MNPWGLVLVAVGILLIIIGVTGTQHTVLQVFKGIPTAARGGQVTQAAAGNSQTSPEYTG
jgi:hypothetical protein